MVLLFLVPYAMLIGVFWHFSNGFEKRMTDPKYYWSKTAPVFVLALLTLLFGRLRTKDRILSSVALMFGAIGDYLIGTDHGGIVPGAIVFGIGHVLFMATFMHHVKKVWKPLLICAVVWGLFVNYICFFHKLHTHFRSVSILSTYGASLLTCLISSGSIWYYGAKYETSTPSLIRFIGYLLFSMSDSTLILTHEVYSFPNSEVLILATYFSSQFLILLGTSMSRDTKVRFE